ncbi:hypothetical protein [Seinonella peptonophila]|uniref:hypothetical protein n=1 Tax=Seinonella peptonophila TaxID=112248 RepID=UPI0015876DC1|nr:hypothetical protein [Seinonella peptonophila]
MSKEDDLHVNTENLALQNTNPAEDVKDTGTEIKIFTEDEVNEQINKTVTGIFC